MGSAMHPFFHPHFEQFMCIQPDGTDLTTRSMVLPEKPPWPSNPLHRPDPAFLHFYLPAMASLFLCYLASALKKKISAAILFRVKYVFATHCQCPGPPGNILGFPGGSGHFLWLALDIRCVK